MSPEHRPLVMRANRMLAAALVELNLVRIEDLETANSKLLEYLGGSDTRRCSVLGILANDLQVLREEDVLTSIIENDGLGLVDLSGFEVPEEIRVKTDPGECWATWSVPIDREDDITLVATAYYLSPAVRTHWEKKFPGHVIWYATTLNNIADHLERFGKKS
jgi:hypothetical protein